MAKEHRSQLTFTDESIKRQESHKKGCGMQLKAEEFFIDLSSSDSPPRGAVIPENPDSTHSGASYWEDRNGTKD